MAGCRWREGGDKVTCSRQWRCLSKEGRPSVAKPRHNYLNKSNPGGGQPSVLTGALFICTHLFSAPPPSQRGCHAAGA